MYLFHEFNYAGSSRIIELDNLDTTIQFSHNSQVWRHEFACTD